MCNTDVIHVAVRQLRIRAFDSLKSDGDPKATVLDLWGDFTNGEGTLNKELRTPTTFTGLSPCSEPARHPHAQDAST